MATDVEPFQKRTLTASAIFMLPLMMLLACGSTSQNDGGFASERAIRSDIEAGVMPDLTGWALNDLGDGTRVLYDLHAVIGLQDTISVASDSMSPGEVVAQSIEPGVALSTVNRWQLQVSDGGPTISYVELPADVAAFADSLPGFDQSEVLIRRGQVYKTDRWLFGLDCDAVQTAYRTFKDGRYDLACPGQVGVVPHPD